MRNRPLGKTGIFVSEIALGTWGLSGGGYGPVAEGEADRVVARALDIGVTLIDTADSYGEGRMEDRLGRVLAGRTDVTVVTKGGTDLSMEPPRKRFDAAYLRVCVDRSRKRLRRERLDVFLLHHPSAAAIYSGEATTALDALKKEGAIGVWGVAAGNVEVARAAIGRGAQVVELGYNLLHCHDLHALSGDLMVDRVGVLARSTLAYGLLAGHWAKEKAFAEGDHRRDRWTTAELERRLSQLDGLRYLVKGDVTTMRGASVRYVLASELVSSAVLGPRSVLQLEQLIRETGGGPRYLPDEDLRALPSVLQSLGIDP